MPGPQRPRVAKLTALAGFAAAALFGCSTRGDGAPKAATCIGAPAPSSAYPGCNPDSGIECDGDYRSGAVDTDFCVPACALDQCCSPQEGSFVCVDRDASGNCPAADLFVDATRIVGNYELEYRTFPEDSCALVEGCVGGPGLRRLLRFDTWTPNIGTADMFLGDPEGDDTHFEESTCHDHAHFETYADYELLTEDGSCVVAKGHKQAFCLLDSYRYPGTDKAGAVYSCAYQGIQRGWQDVYRRNLDCQWVDVTDVPPGEYLLRIRLNTEHILNETNYANNEAIVPVTITDDPGDAPIDISATCPPGALAGLRRACGFTRSYQGTCVAGETVRVGCSATCGLGSCTGDTILRVCETAAGVVCDGETELGSNDDSGCGGATCLAGGDCCSVAQFTCPGTGTYTVWTAPYYPNDEASCTVVAL